MTDQQQDDQQDQHDDQQPWPMPDGKQSDLTIESLARVIEGHGPEPVSDGTTIALTVVTGGGVISGQVVARARWVDLTEERMQADNIKPSTAADIVGLLRDIAPPIAVDQQVNFLHFEEASVWNGGSSFVLPTLRVALVDVIGWTFGRSS